MPIRSTGRTALSESADRGSSPRWAAMPPRTAAAPCSYHGRPGSAPGGGSHALVLQLGRGTGFRSRQLRVRIPPSTRCAGNSRWAVGQPAARRALTSDGPAGAAVASILVAQLLIPAHACLVATVSTPPRYGGSRGSTPRAGSVSTCGCSSAWPEHFPATEGVARSNRVSRSHAGLVQLVEASRSERGGSRFESAVRHGE